MDFSLESVLEFKDSHRIHTHDQPPPPPRKRPNYDGRRRRFLAAQPAERRQCLSGKYFNAVLLLGNRSTVRVGCAFSSCSLRAASASSNATSASRRVQY